MAKVTTSPPKRTNGDGSIYEDKVKGGWRVMLKTPSGERLTARVRGTRADAQAKLNEFHAQAATGVPVGSAEFVKDYLEYWLTVQEAKVPAGDKDWKTVTNYRWALRPVIEQLGGKRLRELEPEHVDLLLARLAAAGMARRSVLRVRAVLGQALDFALKRRKVSWNVARLAEMPATAPPPRPRSLTEVQVRALETAAAEAGPLELAFIVIGIRLGLRPGSCWA